MQKDDVTKLLGEAKAGDRQAESRLMELVYPELKRIAARHLKRERDGHTLRPSALVNEAYIQLAGQMDKEWQNRSHFYAVAAQLMRRILVDYARQRRAHKRDGNLQRVDFTEGLLISEKRLDQILSINEALVRLAQFDERRARVVELRFFGEMTEEEVAEVLKIAPRTVKRDWSLAKAWLHAELVK